MTVPGLPAAFIRLPWRTQVRALHVVALAVVVEVGLRLLSLPRLARALGVRLETDAAPSDPREEVPAPPTVDACHRELDVVVRVMRHWPSERICLRRALVLGRLLRERRPLLRLGVARDDGGLVAHAWIEVDGIRLDPGEDRFVPLSRPPQRDRRTTAI